MRIHRLQNTYTNTTFTKKKENNATYQRNKPNPVKDGLKSGAIWLGFGVALDYIGRRIVVFKKSPTKNSILLNSIIAIAAGGYTFLSEIIKNN